MSAVSESLAGAPSIVNVAREMSAAVSGPALSTGPASGARHSHDSLVAQVDLVYHLAAVVGVIYRPLLFASVNPEVAEAKGVPVRTLSVVFMVLLALAVTMATQAVGTLLLFALVVTPAATAINLTARPALAMLVSTAISLLSVWSGLALSAMFNLPPSFVIVTIVCLVWLIVGASRFRSGERGPVTPAPHGAEHHRAT